MRQMITRKIRAAVWCVCMAGLWGCGSGAADHVTVSFTASGAAETDSSQNLGVPGPDFTIVDTAGVVCSFNIPSATTGGIEIVSIQANCSHGNDDNECIVCTTSGGGTSSCSISCTGVVPSNATVGADSFSVDISFTSTITTDMTDPYGTMRFDVSRSAAGFDLASPEVNYSGCTYSAGAFEMGLTAIDPSTWFTSTASNYRAAATIANVDPDGGGVSHCSTVHKFTATPTLSGLATPGTTATNNYGVLTFKSKICDTEDASPVAQDVSVCTEP